jgi:hypothetical protein
VLPEEPPVQLLPVRALPGPERQAPPVQLLQELEPWEQRARL